MFRLFPFLAFDGEETSGGGTPAPEPVVEAEAPAPEAPAAAPWTEDINALFEEPEARAKVDSYIREKVQPRITKLEQDSAPARQLYDDLVADPDNVLASLAAQLYPDKANEFASLLGVEWEAEEGEVPAEEPEAPAEPATAEEYAKLSPEDREALEELRQFRAAQAEREQQASYEQQYREAMDGVKAERPDLDEDVFAPFVVAHEGDFAAALASYDTYTTAFEDKLREKLGLPARREAPATLGTDGAGGVGTPPVEQKPMSLDDALDSTLAEMRNARNPVTPVGSV